MATSGESAKHPEAVDRSFAKKVWADAQRIASRYKIVLEHEDGEWFGRGFELPGAMSDGRTPEECIASTRECMATLVAYMIEQGQNPPRPARGSRSN